MLKKLKLQFDPNQEYQLSAINSVVDLFDGLSFSRKNFITLDEITPNILPDEILFDSALLDNLRVVQRRNNIPENTDLASDDGMVLEEAGNESWCFPSFTVEMETGTGKTYIYLRTIYELNVKYGFTKFIIIVPSIAIYEGVIKTEEITRDHFRSLYSNGTIHLIPYDGSRLSRIRIFATSTTAEVMVMTLDAFNKITNNIYKPSEKLPGELKPYQYIQQTRPILILDEPQSIDTTEKAKSAIRTLHPLFGLRYSATHRTSPNLVYRLTPLQAYQQNLVKKIQVIGLSEQGSLNEKFLALESVTGKPITGKIKAYIQEKGITKEASITLKQGDNLYEKTQREEHKHGYIVKEINVTKNEEYVLFENEIKLSLGETIAPSRPEVFRAQIEETIRQHMDMQEKLKPFGIKILSLFFVDKVANYTSEQGIIRCLFDQAFEKLKNKYPDFTNYVGSQVRQAYFAKSKTKTGEEIAINTESKNKEERDAERDAFALIMKEKERLLSFEEPVSFIFAHSALKEGWDNPNVFQICTLKETHSPISKRQEIGRGLRLCVNQKGERIFDDDVNILTVIANESYESYANNLQKEYIEDFGEDGLPPKPKRPKTNEAVRNDELFGSTDFKSFWQKLNQKTKYKINIDTPALIAECVKVIESASFPDPVIILTKGRFVITEFTIKLKSVNGQNSFIAVEIKDSDGRLDPKPLLPLKINIDLAKAFKDERLRGYKIQEITGEGDNACVKFSNGEEITLYRPMLFQSEQGQKAESHNVLEVNHSFPIFNLIDRAAQATGLTRSTLNKIFQSLSQEIKLKLIKNPEGFATVFITNIRETLADHVSKNIEFFVEDGFVYDVEHLFPKKKAFPQKELEEAGEKGLYDKVQYDSEVELRFIEKRLKAESDKIVLYFKFPPSFKLKLPRIIGNYNPDWGIIRESDNGKFRLELVRETKGRSDIKHLQFSSERRKIECAEKHFAKLGIDYRYVTGDEIRWWAKKGTSDEYTLLESNSL